jgi:hypothetical protein
MAGVKYREELQALQAVNSLKGNQPLKEKPTSGRFTPSRFQKAVYRPIFAGSFPKGAIGIVPPIGARLNKLYQKPRSAASGLALT